MSVSTYPLYTVEQIEKMMTKNPNDFPAFIKMLKDHPCLCWDTVGWFSNFGSGDWGDGGGVVSIGTESVVTYIEKVGEDESDPSTSKNIIDDLQDIKSWLQRIGLDYITLELSW